MKATLVKELNDTQRLYKLDTPIKSYPIYSIDSSDEKFEQYEYVVSSRCNERCAEIQGCFEVYMFGADKNGEIINWTELPGSQKHTSDIEQPLRDLGYEIVSE